MKKMTTLGLFLMILAACSSQDTRETTIELPVNREAPEVQANTPTQPQTTPEAPEVNLNVPTSQPQNTPTVAGVEEAEENVTPPQTAGSTPTPTAPVAPPATNTPPPAVSGTPTGSPTLNPTFVPRLPSDRTGLTINTNRPIPGATLPLPPVNPTPATPTTPAVPAVPSTPQNPTLATTPGSSLVPRQPVAVNPSAPGAILPQPIAPANVEEIPSNDIPDADPVIQPGYLTSYQPDLTQTGTYLYVAPSGWDQYNTPTNTPRSNDCRTMADPCLTITHALDTAFNRYQTDTLRHIVKAIIVLENGTYHLGTSTYLIQNPVAIIGRGNNVVLDASGQRRMFEVSSSGVEFTNLTFRGGNSIWQEANYNLRRAANDIVCGGTGNYGYEGNVVVLSGHAHFTNVRFHQNRSASLTVAAGSATLIHTTVENNYGAYVGGAMTCSYNAILNLQHSIFQNNRNESSYNPGRGDPGRPVGVAALYNMGTLDITDSQIVNNDGTQVGGVQHTGDILRLRNVFFENNDGTFADDFINASGVPGSVTVN